MSVCRAELIHKGLEEGTRAFFPPFYEKVERTIYKKNDLRIWRLSDDLGSGYHLGTPNLNTFLVVGTFSTTGKGTGKGVGSLFDAS